MALFLEDALPPSQARGRYGGGGRHSEKGSGKHGAAFFSLLQGLVIADASLLVVLRKPPSLCTVALRSNTEDPLTRSRQVFLGMWCEWKLQTQDISFHWNMST